VGSTSAVDIDKDGKSIWVAERCGTNSCLDRATGQMSNLPTVLKFDPSGKLVKSFGAGWIFPHGIYVDRDGNVGDRRPGRRADSARGAAPAPAAPSGPDRSARRRDEGQPGYKFSPDGKLLLTLGKPGGRPSPTISISRTTSSSRPTATSSCPRDTAPATTAS
jgi:hypothetical protein